MGSRRPLSSRSRLGARHPFLLFGTWAARAIPFTATPTQPCRRGVSHEASVRGRNLPEGLVLKRGPTSAQIPKFPCDDLKSGSRLLAITILLRLGQVGVGCRHLGRPPSDELGWNRQVPLAVWDALRVQVTLPVRPSLVFERSERLKHVLPGYQSRR